MAPKYKFAVGIPSISSANTLGVCVQSVIQQEDVEVDILILQNGSAVSDVCSILEDAYSEYVTVNRPNFNLGCTMSWNKAASWAWERGHDKIFLLNDDFVLDDKDTLFKIGGKFAEDPNAHYHICGFSAVAISKENFEKVGPFDEGFYPAYFEDNDYYQRSVYLGIRWDMLVGINYTHYSSNSLRTSPYFQMLNMRTFDLNRTRYVAKWGGMPHNETFELPWNGGEPTFGDVKEILKESGWEKFYE